MVCQENKDNRVLQRSGCAAGLFRRALTSLGFFCWAGPQETWVWSLSLLSSLRDKSEGAWLLCPFPEEQEAPPEEAR